MYLVMGATGHVGSATVSALLASGQPVTAIVHKATHAGELRSLGADIVQADVRDVDALRSAFRQGSRAFLLNPPAPVSKDTDEEERATARAIIAALEGSRLEKVVAASTYGAQSGERIGDLSVLYEFEQALRRQPIPMTIQRAAYYMSNWEPLLNTAKRGSLPTMFPVDMKIPMIAPADIGETAALRLQESLSAEPDICYVEGPARYLPQDVADAFSTSLGTPVTVDVTPRERWLVAYRELGFSDAAAASYARMTTASIDGGMEEPTAPDRGRTTLQSYIAALVARSEKETDDG